MHILKVAALASTACVAFCGSAFAKNPAKYGPAGCGVGAMLIGNKPGFAQLFALSTNGTFYSPFAITTGTSGCTPSGAKIGYMKQLDFVSSNLTSLSREASQGQGDLLSGFAATMGCEKAVEGEFAQLMQSSFEVVFTQPGSQAILDASLEQVRNHEVLSGSCNAI